MEVRGAQHLLWILVFCYVLVRCEYKSCKMGKGGKEKQKDEEDLTAAELASELEEDYDEDDPRSTEQFGLGYQSTMVCLYIILDEI